jgi:hypothetical protein
MDQNARNESVFHEWLNVSFWRNGIEEVEVETEKQNTKHKIVSNE